MKTRWQTSLQQAVKEQDIRMPWERGAPRAAMIARRTKAAEGAATGEARSAS